MEVKRSVLDEWQWMLEDSSWSRRPVAEVAVAEAVAEAAVAETQRLEPAGKIKQSQSLKRKVD